MPEIDYRELATYAPLFLLLIGIITITITLVRLLAKRRYRKIRYYSTIWKKSSKLNPHELMGIRPFNDYYYTRQVDKRIADILGKGENLLIIGAPLSGKTRALYQALINIEKPFNVIISKCVDIELENFLLPWTITFKRRKILIIDDLHRFVEQLNFDLLINTAIDNNIVIAATCQSSEEFMKVKKMLVEKGMHLELVFEEQPVVLKSIPEKKAKHIAEKSNKNWEEIKFNGTIGSIYMPLAEIEKRYNHQCSIEEKVLLKVIKKLNIGGLYVENNKYFINHIKILVEKEELEILSYQFKSLIKSLRDKDLIEKFNQETVQVEEVYLHEIVQFDAAIDELEVLKELLNAFNEETKVRYRIGSIALQKSKKSRNPIDYLEFSKTALLDALKHWTVDKFPGNYAMAHNSLGIVYSDLARAKNPSLFNNAIYSFNESLKITRANENLDYVSLTQLNLGYAYSGLSKVKEMELNCEKAINYYQEALKHFTIEKFPYEYATIKHNMAVTYCNLAKIKDRRNNCKNAIDVCNEALKVRTVEKFPIENAATHHNLALAYDTCARDKKLNRVTRIDYCENAIYACHKALIKRDQKKYPLDFANTQKLIGTIYGDLISIYQRIEDRKRNGELAIKAVESAIDILEPNNFPIEHALAQERLGIIYHNLAIYVEKTDNCENSIAAYQQALSVITEKDFPEIYRPIKINLDKILKVCNSHN